MMKESDFSRLPVSSTGFVLSSPLNPLTLDRTLNLLKQIDDFS